MQGSYVSWQWGMMQKSKRNWLVSSKLTWEIEEFWPEHWKISKMCTLMGCFWSKYVMFELKMYRGAMFYGIEYWCKIWSKRNMCFQKWHEEFSKLSPEHVQKSKNWDFDRILLSKVGQGHFSVTCVTFGNKVQDLITDYLFWKHFLWKCILVLYYP